MNEVRFKVECTHKLIAKMKRTQTPQLTKWWRSIKREMIAIAFCIDAISKCKSVISEINRRFKRTNYNNRRTMKKKRENINSIMALVSLKNVGNRMESIVQDLNVSRAQSIV